MKFSGWVFLLLVFGYACVHDPIGTDEILPPTAYIFPTPPGFPQPNLPLDNPLTVEGIQLGRRLFYDPILSQDSSVACASCHLPQFSFADTARYSKGVGNKLGKRQSMPLFNLAWQTQYFWDGRATSLRNQIHFPIADPNEMNEHVSVAVAKLQNSQHYPKLFQKAFGSKQITDSLLFKAVEQFLLTIISADSKYDRWRNGLDTLTSQEMYGLQVFEKELYNTSITDPRLIPAPPATLVGADCFHCHGNRNNPLFSNNFGYQNNGLDANPLDSGRASISYNPNDYGKFKIPTLRNWAFTAPYMHDGRFKTIDEVLDHYEKPNILSPNLDPGSIQKSAIYGLRLRVFERNALKAFLLTLNDSVYFKKSEYQNPYK